VGLALVVVVSHVLYRVEDSAGYKGVTLIAVVFVGRLCLRYGDVLFAVLESSD
jgi:hypothetical protein